MSETLRLIPDNSRNYEDILESNDKSDNIDAKINTCLGDCAKSFTFGGFDGILSSVIVVAAAFGGNLSWQIVLVLGFAKIIANSLSNGISEYLSSKAHREFLLAEKRRELWQFKNYRDGEIREMVTRFQSRGMNKSDAETVVNKMAQYENFFVGLMVAEELGYQVPDEDDAVLITDAFVMFISFGIFGVIPISIFCLGPLNVTTDQNLYLCSLSLSMVIMIILGMVKSTFSQSDWLYSAVESLIVGVLCTGSSYAVGFAVMNIIKYF